MGQRCALLAYWFSTYLPCWRRQLYTTLLLTTALGMGAQTAPVPNITTTDRQSVINFVEKQATVRSVAEVAIRPDGKLLAWSAQAADGSFQITLSAAKRGATGARVTAGGVHGCYEGEPRWSADGNNLAFLSDCVSPGQLEIYVTRIVGEGAGVPERLTHLTGAVSHLHWSPDGTRLAFLYVPHARRGVGPMAAGGRAVGVIDDLTNTDIQCIAVASRDSHTVVQVTPPHLYAFEYDWSPDSKDLVYTAAAPPGDDNWYIAKLYRQSLQSAEPTLLLHPQQQIALPRWSPDGRRIAFIQGLMSDQGGTGGEIYTLDAEGRGVPENLTPKRSSTPSWFAWLRDNTLVFTEFVGGSTAVDTLNPADHTTRLLWQVDATLQATNEETSLSVATEAKPFTYATSRYGWSSLPEIWLSQAGQQSQFTHLNQAASLPLPQAKSLTWNSDGHPVQGWLLYPKNFDREKSYPLLVLVHGGPAWITTPTWQEPNFDATATVQFGYFVFFPNPRGSYGQGEGFTQANRRDWGFGDLQDTLRGVDAVVARAPVDPQRIGLLGWSYGGSMAMFAGTQTRRFRALVAGAGAADWLSYYGQNSIDQWMQPYFEASPYDDPEIYRRSSAMTFIKQTRTPTLILVGERDGEAPPAQSFQFWHALRELHVPTQLVVYPDEGHSFDRKEDRIDVMTRTLSWFGQYMPP